MEAFATFGETTNTNTIMTTTITVPTTAPTMINISVFNVPLSGETDEVAEERDCALSVVMDDVLPVVMDMVEVVLSVVDDGEVELTDAEAVEASVAETKLALTLLKQTEIVTFPHSAEGTEKVTEPQASDEKTQQPGVVFFHQDERRKRKHHKQLLQPSPP